MTRMCRLAWDSSFFGFPVYKRSIESVRDFSGFRQEVLSSKAKDDCGVCYLFIPSELYPLLAVTRSAASMSEENAIIMNPKSSGRPPPKNNVL